MHCSVLTKLQLFTATLSVPLHLWCRRCFTCPLQGAQPCSKLHYQRVADKIVPALVKALVRPGRMKRDWKLCRKKGPNPSLGIKSLWMRTRCLPPGFLSHPWLGLCTCSLFFLDFALCFYTLPINVSVETAVPSSSVTIAGDPQEQLQLSPLGMGMLQRAGRCLPGSANAQPCPASTLEWEVVCPSPGNHPGGKEKVARVPKSPFQ